MVLLFAMYLHKRLGRFTYAWNGIRIGWREEANFRFHLVDASAALLAGWLLGVSRAEWTAIVLAIGLVLTAELLNTALEELCDMHSAEHDPHIEKIKDLAAGAVLVASIAAAAVGIVVFLPHFLALR